MHHPLTFTLGDYTSYFEGAVLYWAHTKCTVLVAEPMLVLLGWDNLVLGIV